jgi:hypothetical protein
MRLNWQPPPRVSLEIAGSYKCTDWSRAILYKVKLAISRLKLGRDLAKSVERNILHRPNTAQTPPFNTILGGSPTQVPPSTHKYAISDLRTCRHRFQLLLQTGGLVVPHPQLRSRSVSVAACDVLTRKWSSPTDTESHVWAFLSPFIRCLISYLSSNP